MTASGRGVTSRRARCVSVALALAGVVAMGVSVAMFVVILINNIPAELNVVSERAAILALATAHVPVMFIEGTITALVTTFLQRVRPKILDGV